MTATTITSNQYSTVVIDGSINPLTLEAAVAPATPAGVTANYSGADGVFSSYAGASLTLGGDGNAGSVTGGTASGGAEVGGIGVDLTAAGSVTVNDSEYYSNFIHGGSGNDGAEGGAGVSMSGGGSISVAAFSQIGGGGGDVGGTGVEVTGSALTTVTNSGTIYGGSTLDSTSFGGFGPGGTGVSLDGNATLNNSGTINGGGGGDGGTGLILSNGASATNNLAGFIQGGYGVSLGGTGVVLNAGTNLTNDGTINGGSGSGANGSTGGTGAYVGAGATLTNTYEIFGGSGASNGATGGNPGTGVYLNGGTVIDNGSANGAFDHIISGGVDPTSVKYVYNIGDAVQFGTITGSHLVLENGGTIQGDINGLKIGDSIDLANVTVAQAEAGFSENGGDTSATIALPAQYGLSTDLQLTGDFTGEVFTFTSIDGGAGTEIQLEPPCYLRGTQIRTPVADVPVEDLKVGDLVTTVSGESQPIRWLGHRSIDCMRHPNPAAVWPIRIQAGAFAHDLPARDLWVSPGHSLLVEGVLIQAHNLVNGATIVQVPRARVEYWHVELDRHDILLAEGLPAESYLDTGNRSAFLDGGAYLEAHPDFKPKHWADTCVPLVTEGAAVAAPGRR
jgi:hypothetical protein